MNTEHPSQQKRDPDLTNALIALRRAAKRAREQAQRTKNTVVVYHNGTIVEELILEQYPEG
ncbi:MAG: hypothetical protein FJ147_19250 [Deltaproteobacteria bacterium]|nr:hypothetical protein [Deltaproteobacteria bacterium]